MAGVNSEEILAAQSSRDDAIRSAGYELQVQPQPGASPLFYLHGMERRRLSLGDGRVSLRGREFSQSIEWLEEAIRENPAVVSPGVLARPAVQDAILGTFLQVLGPGEVSVFHVPRPAAERWRVRVSCTEKAIGLQGIKDRIADYRANRNPVNLGVRGESFSGFTYLVSSEVRP